MKRPDDEADEESRPGEANAEGELKLGEVLDFMRLLWAVDHGLSSTSKRMREELGVTGPQRLVIRILGRYPGMSAGKLAEVLHVHPSTLTGVLKRLEEKGLIQRRADSNDARRALFSLTPRGEGHDERRGGTVEAAVRKVLSRTPKARLQAAQSLLTELADELDPPAH
jgi:DNA-binding MarR family transcriptional regulator